MVSVTFVLCLPLRALLYVLLKPPLLLYALIKYCVLTIVSIPAYYLGRLRDRVKLLWSWSYRPSLPWLGRSCTAKATQTLNLQEVVDLSAIPHISPSLGLKPGHARRDLAVSRSSSKRRPPIWKQPMSDETERSGQSLSHRAALASYFVSILLQPTSPPDSDVEEEEEERQKPLEEEEEAAERALRLILDLVKISKAHSDVASPEPSGGQQAADIGALCRHAREREKLQSLISELDQLAVEVDPATLLRKRKPRTREERRRRSRSRSPCLPLSPTTEGEVSSGQDSEYQEMSASPDTDTDLFTEASEGSTPDLEEEEEREKPAYTESERSRHTYFNPLSPVHESPEYSQRSTSAESISHLESDLNTALSHLDSETSDLRVDEDALALFESQMRRSRPAATHTQGGASGAGEILRGSIPPLQPPTVSTSTEGEATERLASPSQSEDVFEDCSENFPTIPATPPSLGLKEGHDRRDLAVSRSSSKRRPPSRKGGKEKEEEAGDRVSDKEPEQDLQEEEEGEVPGNQIRKLKLVGAVPVLPSLVDQIHLLKPGFPIQGDPDSESESTLTCTQTESDIKAPTASVPPTAPVPPTASMPPTAPVPPTALVAPTPPTPHGQASGRDEAELQRRGSADAGVQVERKSGLGLQIPSNEPPWIEMRRKSRTTPPASTPPTLEAVLPSNTVLPRLNATPKPSVPELEEGDLEDNIYDTLESVEPSLHAAMYETVPFPKYLHETVVLQQQQQQQQQEVSLLPEYSPKLPPRNPIHMQHNTSPMEEREGRSHRSERRSSSSKEKDRHGSESSRRHRSHSSERESRTSSSRHSSRDKHSSDKHLRSRSRSQERSSSHSSRHSDKHLSRSSERHSHSSSSSKSKESESKRRRLSSSPSTSRKHSTSNPSKSKESPGKGKEKEASSTRKHSSLRESPKSKSESSKPKSESSKSKSESSKSKSGTSKSESSKTSRSKATDTTPAKSSERSKSSSHGSSSSSTEGLKKTSSLTSLRSVKSQGGESTHSLVLESGKETVV